MSIKAIFPTGAKELIVNGLHQWDYGRKIEIHSNDLPALVEVHFACAGMSEAVVRSCAVVQGVAEAVIPDQCLEQTTPVVAWVYEVGDGTGATIKTITLPIIARARPQQSETVPAMITDKYTEMIAAVNQQVGALATGDVVAANAVADEEGYRFRTHYFRKGDRGAWYQDTGSTEYEPGVVYQFKVKIGTLAPFYAVLSRDYDRSAIAVLGWERVDSEKTRHYQISVNAVTPGASVSCDDMTITDAVGRVEAEIYYREI